MEDTAEKVAKYYLLTMKIDAHIKVYRELLADYERDLKRYLEQDIPQSLIDIQHILINNCKAKISALEDLNQ